MQNLLALVLALVLGQLHPTSSFVVQMKIPAVDSEGNGVIAVLQLEARPGSGKVLVNIRDLLFWVDTQDSIRIARQIASRFSGVNASRVDLIYDIETPEGVRVVGGPSAGAAMTIATLAALWRKTLAEGMMITGSVDEEGRVGRVGGILEKAKAARGAGAKLFLVPPGQSEVLVYETKENCTRVERWGYVKTYCVIEQIPKRVDVGTEAGIEVVEVLSIEEAAKYFFRSAA